MQHGYELRKLLHPTEECSVFRAKANSLPGHTYVIIKVLHKVNSSNYRLVKAIREVSIMSSLSVAQSKHK